MLSGVGIDDGTEPYCCTTLPSIQWVCLLDRCIRSSPLVWPWQSQMPYKSYFDLKQVSILVKHKTLIIKNMPNQNSYISDYVFQDAST